MWRVTKGDSEIVLLGMVEPLPKGLDWNKDGVRAALKDSRELLLPPRASAGLFDMLWLLAWNSDALYLPDKTTVESTLPNDLRARFVAMRESIHGDADRYSNLRPPLAALTPRRRFPESAQSHAGRAVRCARAIWRATRMCRRAWLPITKRSRCSSSFRRCRNRPTRSA